MTTRVATFPTYNIKGRQVEYKSFPFRIKSFDEAQGIITGYLSTFGNVDLQKDCVVKGAFKKTLTEAYSRKANGRQYLFALLWMHNPEQPIGGVLEAVEDAEGLLITAQLDITVNAAGIPNNPIATMVFSGFKSGFIDELSMGYLAIQKDYEAGIRYLKEVALLEGSAITMLMAANPQALVPASGVKRMTHLSIRDLARKGVCGNTTWPLSSRDEEWDGDKADEQIVKYITKDDDTYDFAKLKGICLYFDDSVLSDDNASQAEKLACFKLPYCYIVDGKPQICIQRVFDCAGVLNGAHGGLKDVPEADQEAMKTKVTTMYKRIIKDLDDDTIQLPFGEDEKRRQPVNRQKPQQQQQHKDFNDVHQAGKAADCLEDWCDLLNDLTQTMFQIFGMADSPDSDMADCLSQFGDALTKEWLPKAVEANLGQYLNDCGYCSDPTTSAYVPYSMRVGSGYGYMSRAGRPGHKAGRAISAATQGVLEEHQKCLHGIKDSLKNASDDLAAQFKSMIDDHCKDIAAKASDLTDLWADEGQGPAYSDEKPDNSATNHNPPDDNGKSRFARREPANKPLPRREAQPPREKSRDTASEITLADLDALLI